MACGFGVLMTPREISTQHVLLVLEVRGITGLPGAVRESPEETKTLLSSKPIFIIQMNFHNILLMFGGTICLVTW